MMIIIDKNNNTITIMSSLTAQHSRARATALTPSGGRRTRSPAVHAFFSTATAQRGTRPADATDHVASAVPPASSLGRPTRNRPRASPRRPRPTAKPSSGAPATRRARLLRTLVPRTSGSLSSAPWVRATSGTYGRGMTIGRLTGRRSVSHVVAVDLLIYRERVAQFPLEQPKQLIIKFLFLHKQTVRCQHRCKSAG